jgi:hypothetical protein
MCIILTVLGREAYFHELVQTVLDWDYATDAAVRTMHEQIKAGTHTEAYYAHMWETRLSVRVADEPVVLHLCYGVHSFLMRSTG